MRIRQAAVLTALASVLTLVSGAQAGVKTAKPAYLTPTAPGVMIDPILSTGDVVGSYQMTGIPDGLGAYNLKQLKNHDLDDDDWDGRAKNSFAVVMNHELGKAFPALPPGVDARISRLEIDAKTRSVDDAEYLFTGQEGFARFCSATLHIFNGQPFYFTGEEAISPDTTHDGSSIAMDPETGMWRETPQFGHLQHENVVPMHLSKWVFLTSEDDFRAGQASYLYAYIAKSFTKALRGRDGGLYVWKADNPAKTGNASVVKNESVAGHFIPISQAENATNVTLKNAANARNAFKFDRLEDIAVRPDVRGRAYFSDTGKPPVTERGRIYQLDVDQKDPTKATIKMILNGDPPDGDDIVNPDNMDASSEVLVVQEDRETVFQTRPNRVLVYDFDSKTLQAVADVTPPCPCLANRPNNAESSGVIDASEFLGKNWWLLDVQAHNLRERQPGPDLQPNSSMGEDGQLDAIYIPKSTGSKDDKND